MSIRPPVPVVTKDPSAFLPYGFDLSVPYTPQGKPYLSSGEFVTDLAVTAEDGIDVASSGIYPNQSGVMSQLIAFISGGTLNTQYQVRYVFTTNLGNQDARTLIVSVVQK
jgi:hypothetical protein